MKILLSVLIALLAAIASFAQNPYFPLRREVKYTYLQKDNPYSKVTHVSTVYLGQDKEKRSSLFSFTLKEDKSTVDTNRYEIAANRIIPADRRTYFAEMFAYTTVTDTISFDMAVYERQNTVTELKEHTVLGKKYENVICVRSQWITLGGMIAEGEKGRIFADEYRYFAKNVGLVEYRSGSIHLLLESIK